MPNNGVEKRKNPSVENLVGGGDSVSIGKFEANVIDFLGHTLGHTAYHLPEADMAFVGDALFALGC